MLMVFKNGHTPNVTGPFLVKTKDVTNKKGFKYQLFHWSNKESAWFYNRKHTEHYPGKILGWVRIREK